MSCAILDCIMFGKCGWYLNKRRMYNNFLIFKYNKTLAPIRWAIDIQRAKIKVAVAVYLDYENEMVFFNRNSPNQFFFFKTIPINFHSFWPILWSSKSIWLTVFENFFNFYPRKFSLFFVELFIFDDYYSLCIKYKMIYLLRPFLGAQGKFKIKAIFVVEDRQNKGYPKRK